ncbi:MAG: hypothetical protein HZC29_08520, partial [Thaumarchaeota archaeon]|nr:hypothetical protein [Nitrososphaerota archaeon]
NKCYVYVNDTNATVSGISNSSGWCNGTITIPSSLTSNGNATIYINISDTATNSTHNNTGYNNSYVVWIDNTAPVITISTPTNNTYNNSLVGYGWINGTVYDLLGMSTSNISITGTNANNYTVYSFNGTNNTAFAVQNSTVLADGQLTVTIGYVDNASNVKNVTVIIYKDTTAPSAAIALTNSTSGSYRINSSQQVKVIVTDAIKTNDTITLNYQLPGRDYWNTTIMSGTPGTSTTYTVTISTAGLASGQYVPYYISGSDNATNAIASGVGGNSTNPLGNITIDIYCGNEGVALSFCSKDYLYDWNWRSVFLPYGSVVNNYTSLSGNRSTSTVLASISGKYNYVYYYNGSQWTSYDTSVGLAQSDLKYMNQSNSNPYWLNMTSPAVIRIQ